MLKEQMRKRLIQVSYNLVDKIDYFSKDNFNEMIKKNNQDIENTIKKLEKDKNNLELNTVEITRKNLVSDGSFDEVAYDDFEGKNPQFSIYNSCENPANFKYISKRDNIAIHLLFLDIYYDLRDSVNLINILKNNLSTKYILLFLPLFIIALIKNIIDVFLFTIFALLDILNYIFFLMFKFFLKIKFLIKRIKIKFVKILFIPLGIINYLLLSFFSFMIVNFKTLANLINKVFQPIAETENNLLNTNENFTTSGNITRYQVDRDKRSKEHIDLLNQISKQTQQRLQQLNIHKLNYLGKIDFKELVVLGDYEKLPDGILKDFYKQKNMQEIQNIQSAVTTMLLKDYSAKSIENQQKMQNTISKYNNIEIIRNGVKEKINLLKNKNLQSKVSVNEKIINELSNQLEIAK